MSIWFKPYTLEQASTMMQRNLVAHLDIQLSELGNDYLKASMPVDNRTQTPAGLLHGGASCVLAESLASVGAFLTIDYNQYNVVGLEINANHIGSVMKGVVTGMAKPMHLGRTTQVWGIEIHSEDGKKVCVSRMTIAVLNKQIG